ncbi:unnamed protein product [Clavelina lepadiformis]|uniref:THAP-type domain-containing protein n=1 Tax=Clavelina lepadiformis TaxID=159417 RepID=A0ABP0F9B4_CLALP
MSNCCIPGCTYNSKSKNKRSCFAIRRPDFARTDKERRHREVLTRLILSLRDSSKDDNIKWLLHKENAYICESHFNPDDIIVYSNRKALKCGRLPAYNLPHTCPSFAKRARMIQK